MKTTIALIASAFVLVGCHHNPTKTSFPDVPPKLMDKPAELKVISANSFETNIKDISPSGIELSAVTKIITDNYKTCNLYKEQIFSLQNWITEQKKLNP